ncbi:hypothetical protein [Bradyrhizobium sp. AZCC 2289]|uniref:hypothetical protein n=1 Tax=Bradyrhizobium sp. AZCC 2289 TaxID=3117026 RepID=UPI002FF3146B
MRKALRPISAMSFASVRMFSGRVNVTNFNTVQAATFTLLALIIGFTFSMAVSRYDQRKTLEEAEANAIGTEYLRADLLPGGHRCAHARIIEEISRSAHCFL